MYSDGGVHLCPVLSSHSPFKAIITQLRECAISLGRSLNYCISVGTPKFLSPTGSVTAGPTRSRSKRYATPTQTWFGKIPADAGIDADWLDKHILDQTPVQIGIDYFSDGTVHLRNRWMIRPQTGQQAHEQCDRKSPGQLVVSLTRAVSPRLNLELEWVDGSRPNMAWPLMGGKATVHWLESPLSRNERKLLKPGNNGLLRVGQSARLRPTQRL